MTFSKNARWPLRQTTKIAGCKATMPNRKFKLKYICLLVMIHLCEPVAIIMFYQEEKTLACVFSILKTCWNLVMVEHVFPFRTSGIVFARFMVHGVQHGKPLAFPRGES